MKPGATVSLRLENVSKSLGKVRLLNDLSLEIKPNSITGLFGSNGAGKSSTFYIICGLIRPSKGLVFLDDLDISNLALHKRAKLGIAYLPQESSIIKELSVLDNLRLAAQIIGIRDEDAAIDEALALFDIENCRNKLAKSLSGGERRRAEIARALLVHPKYLLLDEPFAGVDPKSLGDVRDLILRLKSLGIGVLISDHNVSETLAICDFAYVIDAGCLLAKGLAQEIAENELVKTRYLGSDFVLGRG